MNSLTLLRKLALLPACILLSSCAAPPLYQPVAQMPPGRAAVYFYGSPEFTGVAKVRHAGTHLVNMDPTVYYVHFPPPGTNYYVVPPFSQGIADWFVDKKSPGVVPIRIEEGKSYYFRVVGMDSIVRVDNATGSREIATCRLAKGAKPETIGVFKEAKDATAVGAPSQQTSTIAR
jgi:hypothetical protein